MFRKAATSILKLWPKNEPDSDSDTISCADSSKGPAVDDEDAVDVGSNLSDSQDGQRQEAKRGPASLQPWRKSYMIQHPMRVLKMSFGKITEDEYKAIMQYWQEA